MPRRAEGGLNPKVHTPRSAPNSAYRDQAMAADLGSAIVGAAGGVVGGAVGGFIALRSASKTVAANERLHAAQLAHERDLAREERTQNRRGDIYVALLRYLNWLTQYIAAQLHGIRAPSSVEPTQEDRDLLLARVMAHGSRPVREEFEAIMRVLVPEVADAKMDLDQAREREELPLTQYSQDVRAQETRLLEAVAAVRSRVQAELQPDE